MKLGDDFRVQVSLLYIAGYTGSERGSSGIIWGFQKIYYRSQHCCIRTPKKWTPNCWKLPFVREQFSEIRLAEH